MGKAQREEWQSIGGWVDQRRCPGLGEEAGSEVECYVGGEAFILLARGVLGGPAEPPLLKKLTDFMLALHLNSFPIFLRKTLRNHLVFQGGGSKKTSRWFPNMNSAELREGICVWLSQF